MHQRCPLPCLALVFALVASSAVAQGIPDARTGQALPNAQAAAVDDATSLLVNPAGLAWVDGVEWNAGMFLQQPSFLDVDTTLVLGAGGASLAGGVGMLSRPVGTDRAQSWRASLGGAFSLNDSFSLGATLHRTSPLTGNDDGSLTRVSADIGTQIRWARAVSLGLVAESVTPALDVKTTYRSGLSLRPLGEWLTLGLDARFVPGAKDIFTDGYWANTAVIPGVSLQLAFAGLRFGLGASARGVTGGGALSVDAMASLGIGAEHLGLTLLGGATNVSSSGTDIGAAGGGRVRISSTSWSSFFGGSPHVLDISLGADGAPPEDKTDPLSMFGSSTSSLEVLDVLTSAVRDASVEGVLLRLRGISVGFGRAAELRAAIGALTSAGKKVVVHMLGGDDIDMFIASAATEIWLVPSGDLGVDGLRAEMVYFGDALARVGVEAEAIAAGKYKSAPRAFTHDGPSDEELEVSNALLDSASTALINAISTGRKLSKEDVQRIIDLGGLSAKEALAEKMVDALVYDDTIKERFEAMMGAPVQFERNPFSSSTRRTRWDVSPEIALIPIVGNIGMGRGGPGGLLGGGSVGADAVVEAIEEAARDPDIKAIVLTRWPLI
jgi:protease IV